LPTPPYKEESGSEELLVLHYRVLALWKLDAREYVKRRIIGMYTFLPAMKGATASLLIQTINEMEQIYPRPQFERHLRRFKTILHRSKTVSEQDKQEVEGHLHMYDSLLDQDPEILERVAKGKVEGEVQGLQKMAIEAVKSRFPALVKLAEEQVILIRQPDALRKLVILIFNAPDEPTARWLLNTFVA
jgi:chromatin segregation and condensation protein Rec8/ScpA/Scc1 (kleisin family)